MKNKMLLLLACPAALTIASCNKEKDWTCACEKNGDKFADYPIRDMNKSDASDLCQDYAGGGVTCKLD